MEHSALTIFCLCAFTAAVSVLGTHALIRFNNRLSFTAAPTSDRWHKSATPNSGGLAILAACTLTYLIAFRGQVATIAVGALVLSALGFIDDRIRMRPGVKFACQTAVTLAVILSGIIFPATPWYAANLVITFLWIVGITNAFNLVDNMDGLCAGVTIIIASFRFVLLVQHGDWQQAALCAVIASAFLGFLFFNHSPAKIFMGDCGSMFAGFALSALAIATPVAHTKVFAAAIASPALTFLYPIFDTALVSVLRRLAGRPVSVGGRDHSSHRLVSLGISERKVIWILWLLTAVGGLIGYAIHSMRLAVIAASGLLVFLTAAFGIFLATLPAYRIDLNAGVFRHPLARRLLPSLRAVVMLIVDTCLAGIAFLMAYLVRWQGNLPESQFHVLMYAIPIVMGSHLLFSYLMKTYTIASRSFDFSDALRLTRVVCLDAALSYGILSLISIRDLSRGALLIYCVLGLLLSGLLRSSLRLFHEIFRAPTAPSVERVAIFGSDQESVIAAHLLRDHPLLNFEPVVFLDYDVIKSGRTLRGIPVCCCESTLEKLAADYRFQSVIIPEGVASSGNLQGLENEAEQAQLHLRLLDVQVRALTPERLAAGRAEALDHNLAAIGS